MPIPRAKVGWDVYWDEGFLVDGVVYLAGFGTAVATAVGQYADGKGPGRTVAYG